MGMEEEKNKKEIWWKPAVEIFSEISTWIAVPLRCFARAGVDMSRVETPLSFATSGTLDITMSAARIVSPSGPQLACK